MASSDDSVLAQCSLSREVDGSMVICLTGDIDVTNAGEIEAVLRQATSEGPSVLVIDLQAVKFLDTAGVRLVMSV